MKSLYLVVLVLIGSCLGGYDWSPIDWRTLPKANPTDKVEFWYLMAPLMEIKYGEWLGYAELYHGGFGFVNRVNNVSLTLNYDADNFLRSNLFPVISKDTNGNKKLEWENGGALFVYKGIDWKYFHSNQTLMTVISGSMYNSFMEEWVSAVNKTRPYYDMFGIKTSHRGKEFIASNDCFDFVTNALIELQKRGAKLLSPNFPKNDIDIYTGSQPTLLKYEGDAIDEIIEFYEFTQAAFSSMSFGEMMTEILSTFEGKWISRIGLNYYRVKLHWPFVGLHFGYEAVNPSTLKGMIKVN